MGIHVGTKIKICGLTDPKEARWVIHEEVDYAGLVMFFEKSKRNNTPENAFTIIREFSTMGTDQTGHRAKTVSVCVSPTLEQVKIMEKIGFDLIQIHGNLEKEILEQTNKKIIRAVNSEEALEEVRQLILRYPDKIEGILVDASEPGSGKTFDWSMLEKYPWIKESGKKLFLAGGLTSENVTEAIRAVNPDVVDVSSGVEISKEAVGKDREKIKEFVRKVRE